MRCANCGKTVPFSGRECPYCHAAKAGEKWATVLGMIGGLIGFFVGLAVFPYEFWPIVGCTVAGMLPGAVVSAAMR